MSDNVMSNDAVDQEEDFSPVRLMADALEEWQDDEHSGSTTQVGTSSAAGASDDTPTSQQSQAQATNQDETTEGNDADEDDANHNADDIGDLRPDKEEKLMFPVLPSGSRVTFHEWLSNFDMRNHLSFVKGKQLSQTYTAAIVATYARYVSSGHLPPKCFLDSSEFSFYLSEVMQTWFKRADSCSMARKELQHLRLYAAFVEQCCPLAKKEESLVTVLLSK